MIHSLNQLKKEYNRKKKEIQDKLKEFKQIPKKQYQLELFFCLLTPQSQAKKCWEAVVQLKKCNSKQDIESCLKPKTRFYKNKTKYIISTLKNWPKISEKIQQTQNPLILRNWLVENVKGLGMKEASHFLRNIGKSQNKVAILDRHILRNLQKLRVIKKIPPLPEKKYLEIEKKFKSFASKIRISIDELDLLFWSKETGSIFK